MSTRVVATLAVLLLTASQASCGLSDQWSSCQYIPGRLIVSFDEDVRFETGMTDAEPALVTNIPTLNALFSEFECTSAQRLVPDGILGRLKVAPDLYHTYVLTFRSEYPVLDVLDRLAGDANVVLVEPDLIARISRVPNDALWGQQWDKRIVGAPAVWDVSVGSSEIICVGIDTGVDWNHPDLTPNLWVNPGEDLDGDGVAWTDATYPGDYDDLNGVDDDGNGYTDDFLGWDFIRNIGNCAPGEDCDSQMDNNVFGQHSHGTHVGGIMAARGDNGIGIAGMSWVGRLMGIRAGYLDNQGNGGIPESASLPAILYAVVGGARVINMSYGGPGFSSHANEVMNTAWAEGAMLFAASGNDGVTDLHYPAAYASVIAVNATDNNDRLAHWSNRGTWTELCAPGASPGVMSTVNNTYGTMSGTSMASPNAAGVAALVWSLAPEMTNVQLRDLIFDTAHDITGNNSGVPPSHLGHGRVDAAAAVASFYPQMRIASFDLSDQIGGDGDGRLESGESGNLVLTCTNDPGWANADDLSMTISSEAPFVSLANSTVFLGDVVAGQTVSNSGNPVIISAASELDTAFWAPLSVTFSSPNGYRATRTLEVRVGRGEVLIVDDDGGMQYESYYATSVTQAGVTADVRTTLTEGAVSSSELSQYSTVIWICGDQNWETLTADDQAVLSVYLNGGGNLMVIGQNVDEDLAATSFYSDYLHAQSQTGDGNRQLSGVPGSPVSQGMSLLLQGGDCANNSSSPSQIVPVNGGEPLFSYSGGGTGAILYSGSYKVVYLAFALEAACGLGQTTHQADVVSSMLVWMGTLDATPTPSAVLPRTTALRGNYPNPFNPTTTIVFDVAVSTHVELVAFDVLGRRVATVMNGVLTAGTHSAVFDGRGLSSGVYFVRMQAGEATFTSRMLLLK